MEGTAHERLSFVLKAVPALLPTLRSSAGTREYVARTQQLLQPHVLGEIVARARGALKLPADRGGVKATAEDLGEELLLRRPAGVGLRLAIAARHGVVEPAMRGILVDVDVVALLVPLEAVAKAPNVIKRDDVTRFSEGAEHRAGSAAMMSSSAL